MWLDVAVTRNDESALRRSLEALEHVGAGPNASSEALTLYGRALALNNELDAAERLLAQATRRYPLDATAFLALADVAERQHRLDAARAALLDYHAVTGDNDQAAGPGHDRAAGFPSADYPVRAARIAALSLAMNDLSGAIAWFQRAAAADPANIRLFASLADAQLRAGNTLAAQISIARGLDRDPENAELLALSRRADGAAASKPH
jgi:predicted Zn-dependent protease